MLNYYIRLTLAKGRWYPISISPSGRFLLKKIWRKQNVQKHEINGLY